MKVNEQRMRVKALYTGPDSIINNSQIGMTSTISSKRNLPQFRTLDINSGRANTTNIPHEGSIFKQNKRAGINSSYGYKMQMAREGVSTRGGLSVGSDFLDSQSEPPFIIVNDQEMLERFMTKQRRMVSSVSSKYLNYNSGKGINSVRGGHSPNRLDGVSTINGDGKPAEHKPSNFNEYQHVYVDPKSNEANVTWITKLREYDGNSQNGMSRIDPEKGSAIHREQLYLVQQNFRSSPPSVYYKGNSESFVKRVTDFDYQGNHLDVNNLLHFLYFQVMHLSTKRIGPTPNISQVHFETGLRRYHSTASLGYQNNNGENTSSPQAGNQQNPHEKSKISTLSNAKHQDFVTIFPKQKGLLSQYGPSFLPPIKREALEQYEKLEVIHENKRTLVKGDKEHKDGVQLVSAFDPSNKSLPKFTDKIKTAHDYNQIRHLLKSNKKMSTVLWELSLRPELYINNPSEAQKESDTSKNRNDKKFFSQPKSQRTKENKNSDKP